MTKRIPRPTSGNSVNLVTRINKPITVAKNLQQFRHYFTKLFTYIIENNIKLKNMYNMNEKIIHIRCNKCRHAISARTERFCVLFNEIRESWSQLSSLYGQMGPSSHSSSFFKGLVIVSSTLYRLRKKAKPH